MLNQYVECNDFEVRVVNGKVRVYYYDLVENFSSKRIIIKHKNGKFIINGNSLVIETMFPELLIINGKISSLDFGETYEKWS